VAICGCGGILVAGVLGSGALHTSVVAALRLLVAAVAALAASLGIFATLEAVARALHSMAQHDPGSGEGMVSQEVAGEVRGKGSGPQAEVQELLPGFREMMAAIDGLVQDAEALSASDAGPPTSTTDLLALNQAVAASEGPSPVENSPPALQVAAETADKT